MSLSTVLSSIERLSQSPLFLHYSETAYKFALTIFHEIHLTVEYVVGVSSIVSKRIFPFSRAIPKEFLRVRTYNIASLRTFFKCFSTAWKPVNKNDFPFQGLTHGLRITHAIAFRPTQLCLGICLDYLSDASEDLVKAKKYAYGANEQSAKIQALYCALLGLQGTVKKEDYQLLKSQLQGKVNLNPPKHLAELSRSISEFCKLQGSHRKLRTEILCNLEERSVEITPDLYALILELDSLNLQGVKNYDALHDAILKALAEFADCKVKTPWLLSGTIADVSRHLKSLECRDYLFQFSNHSVVFRKREHQLSLFDPSEGLALFSPEQHDAFFSHFLNHYSREDSVSIKIYD